MTARALRAAPLNQTLPAWAARATTRGVRLLLPAGTFTTDATVILPAGSVLDLHQGTTITGALAGQPVMRLAAHSAIVGGTILNTTREQGFGADFAPGATGVRIDGTTFRGASINAVYMNARGIRDVTVTRSTFDNVQYGILLNPEAIDAIGIRLVGNRFLNSCADAIELNAATGGSEQRVKDVMIEGNRMSGGCAGGSSSGFGIGLAGVKNFIVRHNVVSGARTEAIHLEDGTTQGVVANNTIHGGGASRPAIAIYRLTDDISVRNNTVEDFKGTGIAVLWDGLGSATRVTIERNVVRRVAGDGITVSGDRGTGPFRVTGNQVTEARGNGIAVVGPHALSIIEDNRIRHVGADPIRERLRGDGVTRVTANSVSG